VNFKKTFVLAGLTLVIGVGIYYFEFIQKNQKKIQTDISSKIITFNPEDINFFQIQKKDLTITLQKNNNIWLLTEPLQDQADQGIVEDLIKKFSEQNMQSLETTANQNLAEFGLDQPEATFIWKSNLGHSEKIQIGSQKNFEGQSFAKLNDDPKIRIVQSIWLSKSKESATYFREKRLYRTNLADIVKLNVKSLNDHFQLEKKDQLWISPEFPNYEFDQNKVRQIIKDFAESTIQSYIFEGEPSEKEKKKKGLFKAPVQIEFESLNQTWGASLNLDDKEKTLFAITTKPTYLVSLDMSRWEKFANVTLDSLRDRKRLMTFSITDVQKFYAKIQNFEYDFINEKQSWLLKSKLPDQSEFLPVQAEKILNNIHDFEISEFVSSDIAKKFEGKNMIILKSSTDELIFQLNWGPSLKMKFNGVEKEVYLARTQLSQSIFAIDKNKIDELNMDRIFKKVTASQELKKESEK
jgi:Domain of unknown function (DUF4340)